MSNNPRSGRGIATFFKDAARANAIVVLDGAEFILGAISSECQCCIRSGMVCIEISINPLSLSSLSLSPGAHLVGVVGCETYSLAYQIEQYTSGNTCTYSFMYIHDNVTCLCTAGMVILTTRNEVGSLDLSRLPKLR